jgi:plasmid stabilization system protein ParE
VGQYVIIYRINGIDVLILHVMHGRREIEAMFGR